MSALTALLAAATAALLLAGAIALGARFAPGFPASFAPRFARFAAFARGLGGLRLFGLVHVLFERDVLILFLVHRGTHQPRMARNHRRRLWHHPRRGLELLDHEIGRHQRRVPFDPHAHPIARLDQRHMLALLVDQEVHDPHRRLQQHLLRPLPRPFLFQRPQNLQPQRVIRPDQPRAMAMRAGLRGRFQHPRTQPLTAHLQQAKARNAPDLNPRAVRLQLFLQPLLDSGIVAPLFHVDEVDDDQPGQVAQAKLPRNLFRRFKVGLQRRLFDRPFLGRPARVHVDGHQRLGHADDDIAARFQLHDRVEHAAQIAFDLIAGKKRHRLVIALHHLGMAGHDHPHEVLGGAVTRLALDQHLVDLAAIEVADRPLDQVAFLIDRRRGDGFQRQLADLFPQPHQIFIIAPDLGLRPLGPCRADDQARAFRHLDLLRDLFQLLAVGGLRDLAGNPAPPRRVGHQNAIAARQRQIGGQRRALVAALFLDDLDQHDLPDLDHFLNLVLARARLAGVADLFGHILVGDGFDLVIRVAGMVHGAVGPLAILGAILGGTACPAVARPFAMIVVMPVIVIVVMPLIVGVVMIMSRRLGPRLLDQRIRANRLVLAQIDDIHAADLFGLDRIALGRFGLGARPAAGTAVLFLFLRAVIGALLLEQRLTIRDRDLVVIRVNLCKGKEPVPVPAVIDKGRLKRRFDPCDLCEVDVSGQLPLVYCLKVEFLDLVAVHHHDAGLFRMGGIDKHLLCHDILMRPGTADPDRSVLRVRGRSGWGGLSGRNGAARQAGPCPVGIPRLPS